MKAIFDRNCNCTGWYNEKDGMVYDAEIRWIGFIKQKYFFGKQMNWLGALINGTFVDRNGRPVAWIQGHNPRGCAPLQYPLTPVCPLHPLQPLRPLAPLRPLRPLTPVGGWSVCNWNEYVKQK